MTTRRLLLTAFVLTLLVLPRSLLAAICSTMPNNPWGANTGWWTADSISASNGGTMTTWADSSGSLNTATVVGRTPPTYQTAVINGLPVVRFDVHGGGAFDLALPRSTQTFTFIAVVRPADLSQTMSILADSYDGRDFSIAPGGTQLLSRTFLQGLGSSATAIATTAFHVVTVTYDGTTVRFYLDGAADGINTSVRTFSHTETAHLGYANIATSHFFRGDIAQAVQWDTVLSDADRCAAIGCLGSEYGITINRASCPATPTPTNTPTGTLTPSNTSTPTPTRTPTATPRPTWTQPLYFSTFNHGDPNDLYIYETTDATNFTLPAGCSAPIAKFPGPGGVGTSLSTIADSLMHYNGKYWVAFEYNSLLACENVFGIMNASISLRTGPVGSQVTAERRDRSSCASALRSGESSST
ncbi:MAG: LamG domain-containing protein [Deltaproteobacteria bacterium]|nr:LamG domain-containing protein [Deltaproteobacteria bacterium]MBI3391429.1 LamG domain-containing protein [Deltaproteobacteria bacterium]